MNKKYNINFSNDEFEKNLNIFEGKYEKDFTFTKEELLNNFLNNNISKFINNLRIWLKNKYNNKSNKDFNFSDNDIYFTNSMSSSLKLLLYKLFSKNDILLIEQPYDKKIYELFKNLKICVFLKKLTVL